MVGATTKKDVEEMGWKFVCEDVRCGAHFRSYMGLRTHQRSCQFHIEEFKQDDDGDDGHDIDALLAARGPPDRRSKKPFYVYFRILHACTIIYLKYRVCCLEVLATRLIL